MREGILTQQDITRMNDFLDTNAGILDFLQADTLVHIMEFLDSPSRMSFGTTCKTLNNLNINVLERRVLKKVLEKGDLKAVQRLLDQGVNFGKDAVYFAYSKGKMDTVDLLMSDPDVLKSTDLQDLIYNVACNSLKEMESCGCCYDGDFMTRIMQMMGSEVKFSNPEIFAACCAVIPHNTVKWLLDHPNLDPGADSNRGVKEAAKWGRLDIVELLFADSRVDCRDVRPPPSWGPLKPSEQGVFNVISIAMKHCQLRVVRFFLDSGIPSTDIYLHSIIPSSKRVPMVGIYQFLFQVVQFPRDSQHYKLLCECLRESAVY